MNRPLFYLEPVEDESLASLVQRHGSLSGQHSTHQYTRLLVERSGRSEFASMTELLLPSDHRLFGDALGLTESQVVDASVLPWVGSILDPTTTRDRLRMIGFRSHHLGFCGRCLKSGWRRLWSHPLVTDCRAHRVVLVVGCPQCQRFVNPLVTFRDETGVRCRCGFDLTRADHQRVDDAAHETQQRLQTEMLSDRDPRGEPVRAMCAYMERAVPWMTRLGDHELLGTGGDSRWDDLYRFDLPPQQRLPRTSTRAGFARNATVLHRDPTLHRLLVHPAHKSWADDEFRDELAVRLNRLHRPGNQPLIMKCPEMQERLAPALVPARLRRAWRTIQSSQDLPDPDLVPAVIPFWEIDEKACTPNLRTRYGAAISALIVATAGDVGFGAATKHLGVSEYRLSRPTDRMIAAALVWLRMEPATDFAQRRRRLSGLREMTYHEWVQATGLHFRRGNDEARAAAFWVLATSGTRGLYPYVEELTMQTLMGVSKVVSRASGPEVRLSISAYLDEPVDPALLVREAG